MKLCILLTCTTLIPISMSFLLGGVYNRWANALSCYANGGVGCGWTMGGIAPIAVQPPPPPTVKATVPPTTITKPTTTATAKPCKDNTGSGGGTLVSTANPNANGMTKKIYSWLKSLPANKKLLSGAFGGFINVGYEDAFSMLQANGIFTTTGKYPAIYEIDCAHGWDTTVPGQETDLVECWNADAASYGRRGGLIAMSHHLPNPFFEGNDVEGRGAFQQKLTIEQYSQILQNGTPARDRWIRTLDKIASGLRGYQDTTVLYRPFHCPNGEEFWWTPTSADRNDPARMELFKRLWVDTFNYLSGKGLNNLLWVYTADDSHNQRSAYYPGDKYVDVVGLAMFQDAYEPLIGYNEMSSLNKPLALAEVGPLTANRSYDFGKLVDTILNRYPKITYFLPWNGGFGPLRNPGAFEAYNNPAVINLGDFILSDFN